MILSDSDIREYVKSGRLAVEPFDPEAVEAAWIDLSLGNEFKLFRTSSRPYIDVRNYSDHTESIMISDGKPFIIHPNEFVLAGVRERIEIPADLAAYVDGRSSLGRIGIVVHVTAGWVDPGFRGRLVLEMTNVGRMPVAIYPGMRICKLVFMKLTKPAERPYYMKKNAKYGDQNTVDSSRIFRDFSNHNSD